MVKVIDHREQRTNERNEAINKLRQLGFKVNVTSSGIRIEVIVDDIDVSFKDGEWSVVIDGEDWTERIVNVQIVGRPFQFPTITPTFTTQIPININSDQIIKNGSDAQVRKRVRETPINARVSE